MTDGQLIERSLADGEAFALLFDRHFRTIHRFARGRVGPELADDVASETFAIAFRRRTAYDLERDNALPWLYGIAVNLIREQRRGEERRLRAYAKATHGDEPRAEIADGLDGTLAAALLALSAQERDLILLHAWAELSYEQLAEALQLPLGTVRSKLSRVRAKLRARLDLPEPVVLTGGKAS